MHTLKSSRQKRRSKKRLGRGNASGKGTTAGKGTKGQKARAGGRGGLKLRGMRMTMLQTPKLRGFKRASAPVATISLAQLTKAYASGDKVSPTTLFKKGLVPTRAIKVKILGGNIRKKLNIVDCQMSASAKEKIEAAGGTVAFKARK